MTRLADKLVELQELEFVVAESRILHREDSTAQTAKLEGKIALLRESIGKELLTRYDRLRKQGMAVAKVQDGVCGACRLNIPQGELIRMRKAEGVPNCPNCGKFLAIMD